MGQNFLESIYGQYEIVRYNIMYHSLARAFFFGGGGHGSLGGGGSYNAMETEVQRQL